MINGIKPSQLDIRNRSLNFHYNKLTSIVNGQSSCISTFNKNFHSIVRRKKFNHIKWKHFKHHEEQDKLCKQNDIVKQKIIKILTTKQTLPSVLNEVIFTRIQTSRDFSKSNYFYERKRFQTSIDRENPEIAKRILKAAGDLNHKKDSQDFKKSRQFVKRLQRFPILKRLQKSIEESRCRVKSQDRFSSRPGSILSKSFSPANLSTRT